jgi:hypothetical protein
VLKLAADKFRGCCVRTHLQVRGCLGYKSLNLIITLRCLSTPPHGEDVVVLVHCPTSIDSSGATSIARWKAASLRQNSCTWHCFEQIHCTLETKQLKAALALFERCFSNDAFALNFNAWVRTLAVDSLPRDRGRVILF